MTTATQLLDLARDDLAAALDALVPFLLDHPSEAPVLRELASLAAAGSDADGAAFTAEVASLVRAAAARERS
jgi:hypothetical protein